MLIAPDRIADLRAARPWTITRDAIPDPMRLRIQTRVNGVVGEPLH